MSDVQLLREGFYEFGEVRCGECGTIDLSGADDLDEAREVWNDHVREEHPGWYLEGADE